MCGIVGEWYFTGEPVDRDRLHRRLETLRHRGKDGEGIWVDGSVGFGHRRLAIIDLGDGGRQPMASEDGRYHITYNGEIYNFLALRKELEARGDHFQSRSDTEVLLHLYHHFGQDMLSRLRGMFAFAIFDKEKQELFFARDRAGKKPFFYQATAKRFSFASELKALLFDERPEIDWPAIRSFLGLQYIPSPQSGFVGFSALPPGHCGIVSAAGVASVRPYDVLRRQPTFAGSFEEAANEIRRLTEESVRLRLVSDIPVGAFLSGGVDSSIVTALMVRASSKPVQTFTMGFPGFGFDEREEAHAFAQQLKTDHHAFEAKADQSIDLVDTLVNLYDAPYADSSALPSWLLARETSRFVNVALAGDGGDELFGGYRRYRYFLKATKLPGFFKTKFATMMLLPMLKNQPKFLRFVRMLEGLQRSYGAGYGAVFTGAYFSHEDFLTLLQPAFRASTEMADAESYVAGRYDESLGVLGALDFDWQSYLPDDLNVKMDRACMAHSLEARMPFLDQELAKFASTLPLDFILTERVSKRILRQAFGDLLPTAIFDRPKRGFQVPLASWFRQEWRPLFVERCLSEASPLSRVCQLKTVERYLKENDHGADHGNRLWMLLVLSTWLQRYV
ncbi:MAG: asparagine synthase (glutamine-hydrolyzing) [bacterium]|nr:asparagine synthase (glutamine-hydrolyzing) [bacterium]